MRFVLRKKATNDTWLYVRRRELMILGERVIKYVWVDARKGATRFEGDMERRAEIVKGTMLALGILEPLLVDEVVPDEKDKEPSYVVLQHTASGMETHEFANKVDAVEYYQERVRKGETRIQLLQVIDDASKTE